MVQYKAIVTMADQYKIIIMVYRTASFSMTFSDF